MITEVEKKIMKQGVDSPLQSMRGLVKGRLFLFLRYFWDEYSQDKFQSNWHIEYICDELELLAYRVAAGLPKEYDLIINVPPGSTKTAIVSVMFPLWCWVNWYWMRFITASYSATLSLESAEYSRDIVRSDKFKAMFPELQIKQDKDTKSNFRIVRVTQEQEEVRGGNRLSTSVGGSMTGFHGHINIIDDPIDPMRAISEAEIKKANYWMDNTLPFRKVSKKNTPTILIMQRLAQNDPTGHLLKGKSIIKHICLPGEIRNYEDKVNPPELVSKYKDGLLDPRRLDWEVLRDLLNLGQYTYGGQVGQDPVPLGGGMFKVDHLVRIEKMPIDLYIEKIIRYWDKAGSDGRGAYTVGVKMCRLTDGRFIVIDVKRGRWSSEEREKIMKATAIADGSDVLIVVEQEPGSGGKESAEATVRNLAGFTVHKDRPTGDKVYRADPYSVQVNGDQVMLLKGDWNAAYIDELENFPNSTYKDQVDASSGAFAKLTARRKVKVLTR